MAILAIATLLGASAQVATSQGSAAGSGLLRVNERLSDSGSVYVEGAYEYLSLRIASSDRLILKRRFALGKISLSRRMVPGRYRVTSWTRSCSGNCSHLDPPTLGCRRIVRISSGATRRATVLSQVGKRCRIAVR